jgi:hypothetical protein
MDITFANNNLCPLDNACQRGTERNIIVGREWEASKTPHPPPLSRHHISVASVYTASYPSRL